VHDTSLHLTENGYVETTCITSEIETRLPESGVSYSSVVDQSSAQLCRQVSSLTIVGVGKQAEEVDVSASLLSSR